MSTNTENPVMRQAFSFSPQENWLEELQKRFSIIEIQEKLPGSRKEVIKFWDSEDIGLLRSKFFLYQRDGIFVLSKMVSYLTGDVLCKKFTGIKLCDELEIKRCYDNNEIEKFFVKELGKAKNFGRLAEKETYVLDSKIKLKFVYSLHGKLIPIDIVVTSGQNSKKQAVQNRLYKINFGVVTYPEDCPPVVVEDIKNVLSAVKGDCLHPFYSEMYLRFEKRFSKNPSR